MEDKELQKKLGWTWLLYKQQRMIIMSPLDAYFQFFLTYVPKVRKNYLKRMRDL